MKCPGCGKDLAEGSEYCGSCGGKITGSTVDYSQGKKRVSDVYETSWEKPAPSESFDQYDEHMANVNWIGFAFALFSMPILSIVFIAAGLMEQRTDMFYVGAFFAAMSILLATLAIRFLKRDDTRSGKRKRDTPSRFTRRI